MRYTGGLEKPMSRSLFVQVGSLLRCVARALIGDSFRTVRSAGLIPFGQPIFSLDWILTETTASMSMNTSSVVGHLNSIKPATTGHMLSFCINLYPSLLPFCLFTIHVNISRDAFPQHATGGSAAASGLQAVGP